MTITFYRFSDNISVQVRALIYEQIVRGRNISTLPTDSHWILNHWILKKYYPQEIQCSEQIARKLLSLYGGEAYTEYIDKNGDLYKTTSLATINNLYPKKK